MKLFYNLLRYAFLLPQLTTVFADRYLNVTAISARNGVSVLECWKLYIPLTLSTQPGLAGTLGLELGEVSNASYTFIPGGTTSSAHTAPSPRLAFLLGGLTRISVPQTGQETIVVGGINSVLIAVDTPDLSETGHVNEVLEDVVLVQVPFKDGVVPEHEILYQDACRGDELIGCDSKAQIASGREV